MKLKDFLFLGADNLDSLLKADTLLQTNVHLSNCSFCSHAGCEDWTPPEK